MAPYAREHPKALEGWFLALILLIKVAGYTVFRGSNLEKNWFRNNPNDPRVKHLKYLPTARGTRLIVSGWWGIARHINYFGDWLMVGALVCEKKNASSLLDVSPANALRATVFFFVFLFITREPHCRVDEE